MYTSIPASAYSVASTALFRNSAPTFGPTISTCKM